jgi:hypothetical protein
VPQYKVMKLLPGRQPLFPLSSGGRSQIIVHNDHMLPASRTCFADLIDQQLVASVAIQMKLIGYHVRPFGSSTLIGGSKGRTGLPQQLPEITFEGSSNQDLWWHARKIAKRLGVVPEDWVLFSCLTDEGLFDGRLLSEEGAAAGEQIPG